MPAKTLVKLFTCPKAQSETLEEFTSRAESELGDQFANYLLVDPTMEPPSVSFLPSEDFGIILCATFLVSGD